MRWTVATVYDRRKSQHPGGHRPPLQLLAGDEIVCIDGILELIG
jgi:hypothetical protein